jgi:predicted amino acid-binding ACT domain protein
MTCKWNPKITDQDKRYLTDLVPGTYIMDGWDAGLIQDNFPEQLTNEEIVSRNRAQTASLSEAYHFSELKHQEFRSAVIDRDNAISDMHSELSKYSVELENIRQTLIERTFLLEQTTTALDLANKELDTRTQELVENRQDLASRSELLEQTTTALDLANKELDTRTQELVENRQDLASRSKLLDDSNLALSKVTDELILLRDLLFERTQMLEVLLAEKKSI